MFYSSALKILILFSQPESWYLLSSFTHFAPTPTQKMILKILGKWKLSDVTSLLLSVQGLSIPCEEQFGFLSHAHTHTHTHTHTHRHTHPTRALLVLVSFLIHSPSSCLLYAPVVSCFSCDCWNLQSLFPPRSFCEAHLGFFAQYLPACIPVSAPRSPTQRSICLFLSLKLICIGV